MSEAERLAEALEGLFARPDHGWFTSLPVAVADLTAEQATRVPAPRFNNVWAVVNHVWFWQQVMLLRLRGEPVERKTLGAEDGWPPAGDPTDDQAWRTTIERVMAVNKELAALVAGFTDEEIAQPISAGRPRREQIIHGTIAHNSYHACEIISIRHMLGLWLERT